MPRTPLPVHQGGPRLPWVDRDRSGRLNTSCTSCGDGGALILEVPNCKTGSLTSHPLCTSCATTLHRRLGSALRKLKDERS